MSDNQVTKIYELRTLGYSDIISQLGNVNKAFAQIKATKQQLQAQQSIIEDPAELAALTEQLNALKIQEAELLVQKKQLTNEAKAAQVARQAEINQQKAEADGVKNLAGSYNALNTERKDLLAIVRATPDGNDVTFKGELLSYDQAIEKLRQLSLAEQDFRRQFAQDKLLVGEYSSGIIQAFRAAGIDDLIGGQVTRANQKLELLNTEFSALRTILTEVKQGGSTALVSMEAELRASAQSGQQLTSQMQVIDEILRKTGTDGTAALEVLNKELLENRQQFLALSQEVGTVNANLRGIGDVGNQVTNSLSKGFSEVKGQVGQLLFSYFGIQAAFQGILSGVETTKELADQTSNLEVELGKSAGGADKLVDALAKIDTRTKLTVLEDIANIAAKAGVSEQNLIGVTQAIDKIKIAFGKDFGDVETGTESLVKIINIFEGANNVTGDNLLKTGNAIRTLANESVASVPFINDFTKRLAGIKGITDISLPAVLGLASGFEQFGQSAEVSSTSLVRIIPKIAADTEKFAQIAGLTQKEFSALLNQHPEEALIRVAQGFTAGKSSLEEFEASFKDSGLGSGRVSSVIGVLAKNADVFRASITSAGQAFSNTANLETAFTAKNENLASVLDKVSKKFSDAANSSAFKATVLAIGTAVAFLISNFSVLIPLLAIIIGSTNTWAGSLLRLVAAKALDAAATVVEIAQLAVANAVLTTQNFLISVYTAATIRSATATGIAAFAYRGLAAAIALITSPLGITIGLIVGLVTVVGVLSSTANSAVASLSAMARQQKANSEVVKQANIDIAEQVARLEGWKRVVEDSSLSMDTRKAALQEMAKVDSSFNNVLLDQNDAMQKLNATYNQAILLIRTRAEAEAAAQLSADKQKKVLAASAARQAAETEFARGKGQVNGDNLSDDERERITDAAFDVAQPSAKGDLTFGGVTFDSKKVFAALKKQEDDALAIYQDYLTVQSQKQAQLAALQKKVAHESSKNAKAIADSFEVDIAFLRDQIDKLNDQIDNFKGSQVDLNKLIKQRDDLQTKLDAALGNQKAASSRGSHLTGDQKDALKDIDALRDQELAEEELYHKQGLDNEANYMLEIRDINIDAINAKLSVIKGANAEERKLIAQLQLEKIQIEQETNDKIYSLRVAALKKLRDDAINAAKTKNENVQADPNASPTDKAQSTLDEHTVELNEELKFQNSLRAIDQASTKQQIEDVRAAANEIAKIHREIAEDERKLDLATIQDIEIAAQTQVAKIKEFYSGLKLQATNANLAPKEKTDAIGKIDNTENISIITTELQALQTELPVYQKLLEEKKITDQQYADFVAKLNAKAQQAADATESDWQKRVKNITDFKSLISNAIGELLNVTPGSELDKKIASVTAEAYSTLQTVMNNYFDQEKNRIQQSLQLKDELIDADTKQLLSRSQSAAESQSIEDQANNKKKQAQQQALNEEKKLRRAQATIAFATQIANILAANAAYGPIVGPILDAIEIGLALVSYESNLSTINSATAAHGISLGGDNSAAPPRGGRFGGRRHGRGGAPFVFRGRQYEAEVDELSVIRTKNAPANKVFTITGNLSQIASRANVLGGGMDFRPGAVHTHFDYGGSLGASLQAPDYRASQSVSPASAAADSNERLDKLISAVAFLGAKQDRLADEQSKRFDRLRVEQVTSSVTAAQKKQAAKKSVGSL